MQRVWFFFCLNLFHLFAYFLLGEKKRQKFSGEKGGGFGSYFLSICSKALLEPCHYFRAYCPTPSTVTFAILFAPCFPPYFPPPSPLLSSSLSSLLLSSLSSQFFKIYEGFCICRRKVAHNPRRLPFAFHPPPLPFTSSLHLFQQQFPSLSLNSLLHFS